MYIRMARRNVFEVNVAIIKIDKQSCYLIGKESISDIILEHESCSKQHAALQYRMMDGQVKLYIIDLKSANGTFLNKKPVPQKRFVELRNSDILGFGASSREYVLIQDD
jgi:smad nuclear-interacting protein 1